MAAYYGPEMSETAKFFLLIDRFFDCLNGRSLQEAIYTLKPDMAPYRSQNDPRFEVRCTSFSSNTIKVEAFSLFVK